MKDYPPSALEHKPLKWTEHDWLKRFLSGQDPVSPGETPGSSLTDHPAQEELEAWVLTLRLWGRETWVQAGVACLRQAMTRWTEALKAQLSSPLLDEIADKARPSPQAQLSATLEWTHKAGERKILGAERLLTEDPEVPTFSTFPTSEGGVVPGPGTDPRSTSFSRTLCIGNDLLRTLLSFQGQQHTASAALHLALLEQAWGRSPEDSCEFVRQLIIDALMDWMERKPPLKERENWMLKYMKPRFGSDMDEGEA